MFAMLLSIALVDAGQPLKLTGMVQDDSGKPLSNVTVFIRTAAPRKGVGVL